jgi:hypothetical protein
MTPYEFIVNSWKTDSFIINSTLHNMGPYSFQISRVVDLQSQIHMLQKSIAWKD